MNTSPPALYPFMFHPPWPPCPYSSHKSSRSRRCCCCCQTRRKKHGCLSSARKRGVEEEDDEEVEREQEQGDEEDANQDNASKLSSSSSKRRRRRSSKRCTCQVISFPLECPCISLGSPWYPPCCCPRLGHPVPPGHLVTPGHLVPPGHPGYLGQQPAPYMGPPGSPFGRRERQFPADGGCGQAGAGGLFRSFWGPRQAQPQVPQLQRLPGCTCSPEQLAQWSRFMK